MKTFVIIPAAGVGSRMGARLPKQYLPLGENQQENILTVSVEKFSSLPSVDEVLVVTARNDEHAPRLHLPHVTVLPEGGASREETVANALSFLREKAKDEDWILVHDAARPLVSPNEIVALLTKAQELYAQGEAAGAVLGIPVSDTVKRTGDKTLITEDIARDRLYRIATPQAFPYGILLRSLSDRPERFTDESSAVLALGMKVAVVACSPDNFKITTPADLATARRLYEEKQGMAQFRVGLGYDSHRLEDHRKLIIGGQDIPYEKGLVGHSDADVLTHAVIDALLGAVNMGNIGLLFPDKDPQWKGADSIALLKAAWKRIREEGWRLCNLDCVLVAEEPKMNPWVPAMKKHLAAALNVSEELISIKPKTNEKMGFQGQKLGMSAQAVCMLMK